MGDGRSGIPREEQPRLSASTQQGSSPPCGGCSRLPWQVCFLSSGQLEDADGAGEAAEHWEPQREMGHRGGCILPRGGEPVPFCGEDSVSNWFCPRHFCSRKITYLWTKPPNYDTSGVTKVGGWEELRGGMFMGRKGSSAYPSIHQSKGALSGLLPASAWLKVQSR